MRWLLAILVTMGMLGAGPGDARAAVPATITFAAHLDEGGVPMSGTEDFEFRLLVGPPDVVIWAETRDDVEIIDGFVELELGTVESLLGVFTGMPAELEVTVRGTTLAPRIRVTSVPYAHRAGVADSLAGLGPADLQERVDGSCLASGGAVQAIAADGSVVCTSVVPSVTTPAGSGLAGGAGTGAATLSLADCPDNQGPVMRSGAWQCGLQGDLTSLGPSPGGGLQGGAFNGDAFLGLIDCPAGQGLVDSAVGWGCTPLVTALTAIEDGGLVVSAGGLPGAQQVGLQPCVAGQVLRADAFGGWQCATPVQPAVGMAEEAVTLSITSSVGVKLVGHTVSVPGPGRLLITAQARLNQVSAAARFLDCDLYAGNNFSVPVDDWLWDTGDIDNASDTVQTHSTVVDVASAGSVTYSVYCARSSLDSGTASATDRRLFIQYFPGSL